MTVLMYAYHYSTLQTVELLIHCEGVDVNAKDKVLHYMIIVVESCNSNIVFGRCLETFDKKKVHDKTKSSR